jgi:two-component system, response regulator RegA
MVAERAVSRTVLIVDDELCVRDALAAWFRRSGWNVRTAERCSQAVGLAVAIVPDHLIVEQDLGDGSGLDLLPRLRAINPAVSGVVISRSPSIAAAVQAIRVGFRDYLAKPIDLRCLAGLYGPKALAVNVPANDAQREPVSLARVEEDHIHAVLRGCRGNISEAARALGLHRRSLQRKLRRLSVRAP